MSLQGAQKLADRLVCICQTVRVVHPPGGVKDVREWRRKGAGEKDVLALVYTAPRIQVVVRRRAGRRA